MRNIKFRLDAYGIYLLAYDKDYCFFEEEVGEGLMAVISYQWPAWVYRLTGKEIGYTMTNSFSISVYQPCTKQYADRNPGYCWE